MIGRKGLWFAVAGIVLGMLFGLLGLGLMYDPRERPSPLLSQKAPPFSMQDIRDGRTLRSDDLAGMPYVINFWASWCVPCQEEAPLLQALYQRHELQLKQLRVLGVAAQTSLEQARAFVKKFKQTYFSGLDDQEGTISTNYGLFGFPETYFVDNQGIIRAKHVGALSDADLERYLALILPEAGR